MVLTDTTCFIISVERISNLFKEINAFLMLYVDIFNKLYVLAFIFIAFYSKIFALYLYITIYLTKKTTSRIYLKKSLEHFI